MTCRSRWKADSLSCAASNVMPGPRTAFFLHRGIAARQFQRVFALGDGVDVARAQLSDGLLHIDLKRLEPEETVQTIRIDRK